MEPVRPLSGIGAPEVKRDLDRADAECVAFEETYKGKLAALAAASDAAQSSPKP
jgi:oligoendopeptidase F